MMTVAVALIVAAEQPTMVYALPEQQAMVYLRAKEGIMCIHGNMCPQKWLHDGDLKNNVEVNLHGNDS
jgi:hypothetical protein